jgi:DNA-binding XRE family transcriptional regulator
MPRRTRPTRDEQNALRRAFYERIGRGEMTIPEAMKAMRKMTGLTQAEFAAHCGVSRRVIQDIERGTGNPTVDSPIPASCFSPFVSEAGFERGVKHRCSEAL